MTVRGIKPMVRRSVGAQPGGDGLARLTGMLRGNVVKTIATPPRHADYVARYCGAVDADAA